MQFMKDMKNIIGYSNGFLQGASAAKPTMLINLGQELKLMVGEFIDSNARVDPSRLQHVYEWYQNGSADARLFDIDYLVVGGGLSMSGTLTQSSTIKSGSSTPFYNKAKIMESGTPVTIKPKASGGVLRFEVDGQTVFSKGPITISQPGGPEARGGFEDTFKIFFTTYLSQSLISVSDVMKNLKTPIDFKTNFHNAKSGGSAAGYRAGVQWMSRKVT